MDSTYSDPAVRAAVHAVASHDPSITQAELDELHARAIAEYAAHRQAKHEQRMQKYTELNKLTKAELAAKVRETLICSAYPPEQWRKDELINHIIGW